LPCIFDQRSLSRVSLPREALCLRRLAVTNLLPERHVVARLLNPAVADMSGREFAR
jgi:hypothetical protein